MLEDYIPIFLFVLVAVGFAIFTLIVSGLVHPQRYNRVKLEPYECGIEPMTDARDRYSVRYYLIAMLFVIFDVETVFMFPWAVIMDELLIFGLIEMLVFLLILVIGYAYAWRKGIMENRDFKDIIESQDTNHEICNTHINIGTGEDISVKELAETIKEIVGFNGELYINTDKPDGTMRKLTDVSKLHSLGWKHTVELMDGIQKMYEWYRDTKE